MCGISGIFHFDESRVVEEHTLKKMSNIISHRGPDDSGYFINRNIGLAHKRLSIIDLSINGRQPLSSFDDRFYIVFNGEIYNHNDLRPSLEKKGYNFKSKSDTEVLLYLYIDMGPSMLDLLNGMFSFVIWDNLKKEVFAARDRMGVKPFYYSLKDNTFYFASEQKALFAAGVNLEIDDSSIEELLLFRFVAGDVGIYKNVNKLLPGHYLRVFNGNVEVKRWWNLSEKARYIQNSTRPENLFQWFEDTFNSSIKYRTVSDVPVGVLMSGGLDSSSISAALNNLGENNINTFTVSFQDANYDESDLAKLVSNKFGMKFHKMTLDDNNLIDSLEEAAWVHDEPLMHQNDAQLLAISKYAKSFVSVLMSGEGGDELMCGYVRYKALSFKHLNKFINGGLSVFPPTSLTPRLTKLKSYYSIGDCDEMVLLNSCNLYPSDLAKYGIHASPFCSHYRNIVLNEALSLYSNDIVRQSMYLDQHTFLNSLLDRNDRTTMAASIECREPFLDYRIVEMLAATPTHFLNKGKKGKYILLNSVGKYLPEEIRKFKKWGFGVPWEHYMRSVPYFINLLNEMKNSEIFKFPILEEFKADQIITKFEKGNNEDSAIIRQLMMIHIWMKVYLKKMQSLS